MDIEGLKKKIKKAQVMSQVRNAGKWSSGFLTRSDTNSLFSLRKKARSLEFQKRNCTISVAKTKVLIRCVQLICTLAFQGCQASGKSRGN